MKKLLLTGLFACITAFCFSRTTKDSCDLKVCIVNKSLYYIDKAVINDILVIESLAPNEKSDFKCSQSLFATFKSDITFTRKRLLGTSQIQIISYPIDNVGEEDIKAGKLELVLNIEKEGSNKYRIHFDIKQISTDLKFCSQIGCFR